MNQMNTPEVTLNKALEFLKTNDEENTLIIINDFLLNSKKKYWTLNHEQLIFILVDLCVKRNRLKLLREGLNYYRSISQNTNIESLASVLNKAKELVEEKFLKAHKSYQDIKLEIQDLDSEDAPELLFLYSFNDDVESREKEELINSQKFIWDTYKILLDLTKTNSKLLSLYAQILKSAFVFCKENRRKVEFKRLCDSVRGYLQTLIKTEKKQFFQNKVQISRPEVLKILIQIRISLLDTATDLEQWQEAFKTAEDIIFLMDKYEKSTEESKDGKTKKTTKIPPIMKLEFYSNVEKLLWISDYHLYHAHATILIKELANKALKWIKGLKTADKMKEAKLKIEKIDIENLNNRIILATLVTPYKNSFTNYLNVGNELFESGRDIETQTCSRMMSILKMNIVPGRKHLVNFIESNHLLEDCDVNIRTLYNLIQVETNPILIAKRAPEILSYLRSKSNFVKFADLMSNNLALKCLLLMGKNYESISFVRLTKILSWVERESLEDLISENTRTGLLTCIIDHRSGIIRFKNSQGVYDNLNETMQTFINTISKLTSHIIVNDTPANVNKLSHLREILYKEIHSHNTNSLVIYDALIANMEQTNSKLATYLEAKARYKETLKESQSILREEQKKKADEEAKMMKELLKDEQKKKEFDIQLKKFLIDRLKVYTNVLYIDGKKVKLDDILKDLSKYSDEQLIKLLEKEEYEFKTKKEKKFKQSAKDTDYLIREFRRRDYEFTIKSVLEEEKAFNASVEEESKKSYNEKIGLKSNLTKYSNFKGEYFNAIQAEREIEYTDKMKSFSEQLYKKIFEDLVKDIGPGFKHYVDDFRKREEEAQSKQGSSYRPATNTFMKKGEKFIPGSDKAKGSNLTSGFSEFKKGHNFVATTAEPKPVVESKPLEFKKGEKLITTETPTPKLDFVKGTNVSQPEKRPEFKRSDGTVTTVTPITKASTETGFNRGANVEAKKEATVTPITKASTETGFNRGANVEAKKDATVNPIIRRAEPTTTPVTKPSTDSGFSRATKVAPKEEPKKTESTKKPDEWSRKK